MLVATMLIAWLGGRGTAWASTSGQGTIPTAAPPASHTPMPAPSHSPGPSSGGEAPAGGSTPTGMPATIVAPGPSATASPTSAGQASGSAAGQVRVPFKAGEAASASAGSVSVVIGPGAVTTPGILRIEPVPAGSLPSAGRGFAFIGKQAEITLLDAGGKPLSAGAFAGPIQVCFGYTEAELALVGNDPARFVVRTFNPKTSEWEGLPTTPDLGNRRVCGSVRHLSLFALAAPSSNVVKVLEETGGTSVEASGIDLVYHRLATRK